MNNTETVALIETLRARFERNPNRHSELRWDDVLARLDAHPEAMKSLEQMESTGGEPDVIGANPETGQLLFVDCSAQSPAGRRNVCYDRDARLSRKKFPPAASAAEMAAEMGVELLTEEQYRTLQQVGEFDTTTSSWIRTPDRVRSRGGALFCDRRYDAVFTYHNGADSYYTARGFCGMLEV